ncbi:hypothetical protein MKW94_001133, partial [Papaver nudicaule]|nr:hypothetical protein [Papaver nudicaule]
GDSIGTMWSGLEWARQSVGKENPGLRQVVIVLDGSATDKAYFEDRVRVWVNESNVVIRVPKVG